MTDLGRGIGGRRREQLRQAERGVERSAKNAPTALGLFNDKVAQPSKAR